MSTPPIYLHYIGSRYYSDDAKYIREGVKYGCSRACSFNMVKELMQNDAIIYYARYEYAKNHARIFAIGRVVGLATTYPIHTLEHTTIEYIARGCGSYYSRKAIMSKEEIVKILERIKEGEARKYKWFIRTDISAYSSIISHIIRYRKQGKNVTITYSKIPFTRGWIKLRGGGKREEREEEREVSIISKYHLARDKKESKRNLESVLNTRLDVYLGG